jgi:uncharacterized protein YqeY
MELLERLNTDLKKAMFAHNDEQTALIRMLKSAIKNAEIALGSELDERALLGVLEKQAKQRRDSIEQYRAGGREDLADKEARELELIDAYLPAKMPQDELEKLVDDTIIELAASSMADMGKVIQAVMGKVSGTADGKTVSNIVKVKLG